MSQLPGADIRCRALLLELSRYLDGELTPARCKEIEQHVGSCTGCTAMAARLRETMDACRAAREQHLPADVRERARARIKALLEE
jgi:anti-sigma factor RsiW